MTWLSIFWRKQAPKNEPAQSSAAPQIKSTSGIGQQVSEKSLSELLQLLSAVSDTSKDVTSTTHIALEKICQFTGWPLGHAYLINEDGDTLQAASAKQWFVHSAISATKISEFKTQSEATEFKPGVGLIGKVLQSKNYISVDDVTSLPGYKRASSARNNGIHGCFAFPVLDINNDRVRCILEFFNYDTVLIDEQILSLTHFIGKQIAFAYANIDAHDQQQSIAQLFEKKVSKAVASLQKSAFDVAEFTKDIETSTDQITTVSSTAKNTIETSLSELTSCMENTGRLQTATKEIEDIASNINKIADQTNLLALNATIEAARAGDVGRGFAVVAEEVKALAKHTTESTARVSNMVKNIGIVSADIQNSLDRSKKASDNAIEGTVNIEDSMINQKGRTHELNTAATELQEQTRSLSSTVDDFFNDIIK